MNQMNPYGAYARTDMFGRPLPAMQPPAYLQYQMQPYTTMPQNEPAPQLAQPQISCEIVGDYETVKAAQISLDGQPKYYPLSDGSTIYRKQLMADGTSKIFKYSLTTEDGPTQVPSSSDNVSSGLKAIEAKMDVLNARMNEFMNMWGGNGNDGES